MKARLMFREKDFDLAAGPCFGKDTLCADLALKRILCEMAGGDEAVACACGAALYCPLRSREEILYRQQNLRDALENPEAVRRLYGITVETEKRRKSSWYRLSSPYLSGTFTGAVELMKLYIEMLARLRAIADDRLSRFRSDGFCALTAMLRRELSEDYLAEARAHLDELRDRDGMVISAKPGGYLQGVDYVLRRKRRKGFRLRWSFAPSYTLAPRDDAGCIDLGKRRERAVNEAANALAQAAEHLEGFFAMLRAELAFYVGCLNLADSLKALGMPICFPDMLPMESRARSWRGLYDAGLALTKNAAVVGNELDAADRGLYLITGANQGGKSTFLRSVGQAQLMAQCGMFVGAERCAVPMRSGVFSHFKREEDSAMKSGKLDEELARMSGIADRLREGALMLFNESFAATNEREGSEICRQIARALMENGIEVFSVTHLYTYAAAFFGDERVAFLRAQRLEDGARTFRVVPGEPMQTAFGEDLYQSIFGEAP